MSDQQTEDKVLYPAKLTTGDRRWNVATGYWRRGGTTHVPRHC